MKKSELRHAVSTVRWSIDQRLSIEAKLRQNVRKPEPIDDSDEEFIETDLVTMDDVMTEEDMRMERKRIIKRTVIGLLAAAVLGAGGMTAAVAMQRRGGVHIENSSTAESSTKPESSGSTESSAAQKYGSETVIVTNLNLHLTDQQDVQGMRGAYFAKDITESEQGYYFVQTRDWDVGPRAHEGVYTLMYSDKESDAQVTLCNRANCLHDGNAFCAATTLDYRLKTGPVWLDGYLYALAKKPDDRTTADDEAPGKVVLLRYEPDGSGITEIAEIMDSPDAPSTKSGRAILEPDENGNGICLIAHRGKLWYLCSGRTWSEIGTVDITGWYRFGVYDPETAHCTAILSADGLKTGFRGSAHPTGLAGDGDYVYFSFHALGTWDEQNKMRSGVWRFSCVTGGLQQTWSTNEPPMSFYVSGDQLFYDKEAERDPAAVIVGEAEYDYYLCDMPTGKETCFLSHTDHTDGLDLPCSDWMSTYSADRQYIGFARTRRNSDDTYDAELWIYDWDGSLLKREPLDTRLDWKHHGAELHSSPGWEQASEDTSTFWGIVHFSDGTVYLQNLLFEYSCSIADILAGKAEWKSAFRHTGW